MAPIRLVIADSHTLVRAGFRVLLGGLEGITVVAEAGGCREALALVDHHRPDLLLTAIAMPRMSGLELAERVTREFAPTRVIVLTMHAGEEYARRALQAGARGYLLKDSGPAELEMAVRAVAGGEMYLSPAISEQVNRPVLDRGRPAGASPPTPRQREILRLIAEGQTTKGIARRLGISGKTVEAHRAQIMDRLAIHDIAGLVRYAIRMGIIGPEG